jgi:hypothetical protein
MAARNTLRRSLLYGKSFGVTILTSPHFNFKLLDELGANEPFNM